MPDIVYVLTNPAMPGIVKIGMTNTSVQDRMKQLYTTGVPLPFECAVAVEVGEGSAKQVETALHTAFSPYKLNKEFFEIESYQAEAILRAWPDDDVTPHVKREADDDLAPADRVVVKDFKRKRSPNLNFKQMRIPVDSILVSTHPEAQEATVKGDTRVSF